MNNPMAVIEVLDRAPDVIVPLLREFPPSLLKRRPSEKKWSAHEHACHLATVHQLFLDRLDLFLNSPNPAITPYHPDQTGPDGFLLEMDFEESLLRYVGDRRRLVARIRKLSSEDWNRTADHAEYSHYSVLIMFRHLAMHDFLHAYRIEELLLNREWKTEWEIFASAT